ncbi:MAG: SDR family NAD(P)-dependent oxidoreductase [Phycisphaerae bacterium]
MNGPDGNGAKDFVGDWRDSRLDLTDKVAVVTGAARGIGRATCVALAREGIKAIAVVDQLSDVTEFADQANEHFGREVMVPFSGDVTSAEFRGRVFTEMQKLHGVLSICVPAAGITQDRLAVMVDRDTGDVDLYCDEAFRRVLEVDLIAPIYWAMETVGSVARDRHARGLKRWKPSDGMRGCIILIGSVSSAGNRGQISYATAKAGLEGAQATLTAEAMYHTVSAAPSSTPATPTPPWCGPWGRASSTSTSCPRRNYVG